MTEYRKEEYWSRFASTFDEDQKHIVGEAIQQTIIGRLSEESDLGEVVELGCGRGFFTRAIAKNAIRVLATDLSDEMLVIARTQLEDLQNVTVEKVDCENTAFPSGRFDTVVMVNVVHFIENPTKCLQESYRILKSGGVLLLADYTGYGMSWFGMMKMGMRFFMKWGKPPPYGKKSLSPDELGSLVEREGFKVEVVQLVGDKTKAVYLKGRKK
jgi:2-polyprenyl-3-methyl-5-hydroxy-6-metoxy-1,4-benzoquinol methylase